MSKSLNLKPWKPWEVGSDSPAKKILVQAPALDRSITSPFYVHPLSLPLSSLTLSIESALFLLLWIATILSYSPPDSWTPGPATLPSTSLLYIVYMGAG
jgi:hypothetical protein